MGEHDNGERITNVIRSGEGYGSGSGFGGMGAIGGLLIGALLSGRGLFGNNGNDNINSPADLVATVTAPILGAINSNADVANINANTSQGFAQVNGRVTDLETSMQSNRLSDIINGVGDKVTNGNFATQAGFSNIQHSMDMGFCKVVSDNALQTMTLNNSIHAEGEATRALINANTVQDLRDRNQTLTNALALEKARSTPDLVECNRSCNNNNNGGNFNDNIVVTIGNTITATLTPLLAGLTAEVRSISR